MRVAVAALAAMAMAGMPQAGAAAQTVPAEWDTYEIDVRLDEREHDLVGQEVVTVTNRTDSPWSEVLFFLLANLSEKPNPHLAPVHNDAYYGGGFEPATTNILGVRDARGEALPWAYREAPPVMQTYSLERALLAVRLPQPLGPGESVQLTVRFETHFPDSYMGDGARARGVYTWRFGWNPIVIPPGSVERGAYELPGAEYRVVRLDVPGDFVVASGADEQTEEVVGERKLVELRSTEPRRSIPLTMSETFEEVTVHSASGTPIIVYYQAGHEHQANYVAAVAAQALDHHERAFGPYPYQRLTIAQNPNPGAGMGADGQVLLTEYVFETANLLAPGVFDRLLVWFIAHEVAHQWFGLGIGADFDRDNWLSEAFSSYGAYRMFEERYGIQGPNLFDQDSPEVLVGLIKGAFGDPNFREWMSESAYLSMLRDRMDEPVVQRLRETRYYNHVNTRAYEKGYLVARALEALIGREQMDAFLREAGERFRHKIATTEEFLALAGEVSGQDVAAALRPWLLGDGQLDLAVERFDVQQEGDDWKAVVAVRSLASAALPATVRVTTAAGETREALWNPASGNDVVEITTPDRPVAAEIDPGSMVPDVNRLNNRWPFPVRFGETRFSTREYHLSIEPWLEPRPRPSAVDEQTGEINEDAPMQLLSGAKVRGAWRDEHAWWVAAGALYDMESQQASPAVDIGGSLALGRESAVTATMHYDRDQPQALVSYTTGIWVPENVGMAAPLWYARYPVAFTVGARAYEHPEGQPAPVGAFVEASVGLDDSLKGARAISWTTRLLHRDLARRQLEMGGRTGVDAVQMVRLAPNVFGVLDGRVACGWGDLPDSERPVTRMRGFGRESGQWAGRLEAGVTFPIVSRMEAALFNLTVVKGLEGKAFVEGGAVSPWAGDGGAPEDPRWRAAVGVELGTNLAFPMAPGFSLRTGVAVPVWTSDAAKPPVRDGIRLYLTLGGALYM